MEPKHPAERRELPFVLAISVIAFDGAAFLVWVLTHFPVDEWGMVHMWHFTVSYLVVFPILIMVTGPLIWIAQRLYLFPGEKDDKK